LSTSSSPLDVTEIPYESPWPTGANRLRYSAASCHDTVALAGTAASRAIRTITRVILLPTLAYIICEPCVGTKDTACVDVCPVDCIHPRKDEPQFQSAEMLYIHPDECIDCGACVPACPVEAIFALDETPEKWKNFIGVNAEFFQSA
jgi:ferredoxin